MEQDMFILLNDTTKNNQLYSSNYTDYCRILKSRITRRNNGYSNYINSMYSVYPKPTLLDHQNIKNKLEIKYNEKPSNQLFLKIQEIQTKIDNQDYCVEGTPEWTTRQEFLAYAANFQWPDATELAIRQQEEADLLALLGN